MIVKSGSTYGVKSESGKNLGGGYKTKAAAAKRLKQVEYFKHKDQVKSKPSRGYKADTRTGELKAK